MYASFWDLTRTVSFYSVQQVFCQVVLEIGYTDVMNIERTTRHLDS